MTVYHKTFVKSVNTILSYSQNCMWKLYLQIQDFQNSPSCKSISDVVWIQSLYHFNTNYLKYVNTQNWSLVDFTNGLWHRVTYPKFTPIFFSNKIQADNMIFEHQAWFICMIFFFFLNRYVWSGQAKCVNWYIFLSETLKL